MDAAVITVIGQLGIGSVFVFAAWRLYSDMKAEREQFRLERSSWIKILEKLDRTNNALVKAIESNNFFNQRYGADGPINRRLYKYGPEPDVET